MKDESNKDLGFVLIFEDLSELIKAQKAAAWREVAQRIAHEIKNPLTPIQLSRSGCAKISGQGPGFRPYLRRVHPGDRQQRGRQPQADVG